MVGGMMESQQRQTLWEVKWSPGNVKHGGRYDGVPATSVAAGGRIESQQRQSWWEVGWSPGNVKHGGRYDRVPATSITVGGRMESRQRQSWWEVGLSPSNVNHVRGGITLREGIQLIEEVYNTGRLSAFDMMEVNLRLGNTRDSQLTLEAAQHLLRAVFVDKMRYTFSEEKKLSLRLSGDMVHPT
uniref:Uncharacterized protein n=1 Tax=Timema shepardi TaxID=629360 RepID=A0A7R9AWQ3_TIMSH|nr:unnamed protein product [Timema shepardi]